ncbi:hypothetical protein XO12_09540 [Marinitoga sp. 1154]|uniref:chemotaxis protein CheW n=1 Tax=Marinitoga sp. 1154 TaxID=1643335 RepID=UPI0015861CC8|nr:chemotaxis protein CheW [Marinitoga sp. 1154]NUV00320.1 hypothetical protein [Marinitoga sp. 1154]
MNYLIFELNKQNYCIPMLKIIEIIRIKKITRIPLFPEYIQGLINLRGEIIPVVNLKVRLGYKEDLNRFSKIIIIKENKPFGIIVDRTKGILNSVESEIESKSKYVESILKKENKDYILLNTKHLIEIKRTKLNKLKLTKTSKMKRKKIQLKKIMVFELNHEKYGLMIDNIQEIVRYKAPDKISKIPEYIKGIITVRDEVIPIVDLNYRLYNKITLINENTKLIIINVKGIKAGLIVDNTYFFVDVSEIKKLPHIIKNKKNFKGFLKYKNESIMVLEPEFIINESIKALNKKSEKKNINEDIKKEKYILFRLDNEKYAIKMKSIIEINKINNITKIPKSPDYVKGLINLRGEAIPIIDLKKRFNSTKHVNITKFSRVMVVSVEGKKLAFLADSANEIVHMNFIKIKSDNQFVMGTGDYDGDTILVLDLKKIIQKNDLVLLNKSKESILTATINKRIRENDTISKKKFN